jgi:hypothetical protein
VNVARRAQRNGQRWGLGNGGDESILIQWSSLSDWLVCFQVPQWMKVNILISRSEMQATKEDVILLL